jgi:hypothetical protein
MSMYGLQRDFEDEYYTIVIDVHGIYHTTVRRVYDIEM